MAPVAFAAWDVVQELAGGAPRVAYRESGPGTVVDVLPDASHALWFREAATGGHELVEIDVATGHARAISDEPAMLTTGAYASDGTRRSCSRACCGFSAIHCGDMPSLAHHLATMAYQNAWANHRLLAACARLSQADFVAPRTSFFPSIVETYNHIVTVDWYYVDAIERWARHQPVNPDPFACYEPELPFDTCAALSVAQHAVDRRLVELCVGLTDARLDELVAIPRTAGIAPEPATRILAHLFEHQLHHRGQIHAMLAGTPVAPPQLDEFFCANEAHLRAAELAELGYSEAMIWG